MPQEFEGDLAGAEFWGADLRGARFRDVDLSDARISHAWLVGVEVDAYVDRLVVNGVDVTAFVNEHDPWFPLRTVLRPTDPASMRRGWGLLGDAWTAAVARVRGLPDGAAHASVGGEWSFVQTLRHLVLATDKWFVVPLLGGSFQPLGLPDASSARTRSWPELDRAAEPSLDDVLAVRAEQAARVAGHLAAIDEAALDVTVDVVENGPHSVRQCVATVLEEEFWHLRYADRDLTVLESGA
jgi:hypothetical protein